MRASTRKKSVTGRDGLIMLEALTTALVSLEQLPEEAQPRSDMEDMKALLAARWRSFEISLFLAQAKCRLRPEVDPITIYQEYGIEVVDDGESGGLGK